jgi:DNA repair photolyase
VKEKTKAEILRDLRDLLEMAKKATKKDVSLTELARKVEQLEQEYPAAG